MKKNKFIKIMILILCFSLLIPNISQTQVFASGLVDELLNISFYRFHYMDENNKVKSISDYNWGSKDETESGMNIDKTGVDTIKVTIKGSANENYINTKPVLMWIHKGDALMDTTKMTDIEKWYENKLEETYLICEIPDYTQDIIMEINVPMKLNMGMTGILNGGFYEIEFFSADAIPSQLQYAYQSQTYTIEELEEYMNTTMAENIETYYDVDSGFRSDIDGFTFRNSDYENGNGVCAGIAAITTAKYNGYTISPTFKYEDVTYEIDKYYTWYNSIYTNNSIRDLTLEDMELIEKNSPSYNMIDTITAKEYPMQRFETTSENDTAFYSLLKYYLLENNMKVFLNGNAYVKDVKWTNLENRWSIIDYMVSYLRQGKAVTVNISKENYGGHSIVGYKMEKIDNNTYRLYCYDSNFPDDMIPSLIDGTTDKQALNEDGSYKNRVWKENEIYIDFKKTSKTVTTSDFKTKEFDVFEFDATHTSIPATSSNGLISFSICMGEKVGVFNYGNESNEIINFKAYPIIENDNSVNIRTFAYYKSGEIVEVTNSINTKLKMDYSYIGWYKIKDSKITLTKENAKFNNEGNTYIECYVSYDNYKDSDGQVKVRIPVSIN